MVVGNVSGVIVDTPSSFATGQAFGGKTGDNKYALVKACVDAYKGRKPFIVLVA